MGTYQYTCRECGAPATVNTAAVITRTCSHTCGVILSLNVRCRGLGEARDVSRVRKLFNYFHSLGMAYMERLRGRL